MLPHNIFARVPAPAIEFATAKAPAPAKVPAFAIENATNITVYHINPLQFGAVPINMDTGDAAGDLFFDLFETLIYPIACPNGTATPPTMGNVCVNPEAEASEHLMVNKLVLEVDASYSDYAKCNIGDVNDTDGRGHPCPHDTYCCFCGNQTVDIPCGDTVGRETLNEHFSDAGPWGGLCPPQSTNATAADCYRAHAAQKLTPSDPGYWYSSLAESYCGPMGRDAEHAECTWRVVAVDKIVTRACHAHIFGSIVQAQGDPACLESCGPQRYNASSTCWADCFYHAALGPDADTPGGGGEGEGTGMSLEALVAAWVKPFKPVAEGGCPAHVREAR